MVARIYSAGFVLLNCLPLMAADDLVVPPAPSKDSGANVQVPEPGNSSKPPAKKIQPIPSDVDENPAATPHPIPPKPPAPGLVEPPTPGIQAAPPATLPPDVPSTPMTLPNSSSAAPTHSPAAPLSTTPPYSAPNGGVQLPSTSSDFGYGYGTMELQPPQYNTFSTIPNYGPPQLPMSNPALIGGEHPRYPYYSYRRPWYTPGPVSRNVNIIW